MKVVYVGPIVAVLCMGLIYNANSLAGLSDSDSEKITLDQSFDRLRRCALQDGLPVMEENYGYTETPIYQSLEVQKSDNADFEYMAHSLYYRVYFKGTTARMVVQNTWIEFELVNQELGDIQSTEHSKSENTLSVPDVFASVDLFYEVESSLLKETLTLKESKSFGRVVQEISWNGLKPEFEEDGSILFVDENGKEILKILPPFMKDSTDSVCTDMHYELIETEMGYELHKVIDEKGLEWLENAAFPIILDPTMQTLEDAWGSSGLTPYGRYFNNLKEYVNPANGHLTITQTDLVIPGRGISLVISRVYETPAVFYGEDPYGAEYEAPPVNVGKGWQLDLPWVGSKYLHLWSGTIYKIVWTNNTFENHKGSHFRLVKNGDNTYMLTTASGMTYEFNTSGKLTQIKDVDQNTITFTYTSGVLTSITDTIGRSVSLSYSSNRLWKISYNGAEIEFSYDANGCLQWMEDFLNRRTSYYYNTGYNNWLLSKITYPTTGYTTYAYNRFSDSNYYKYYVTNQRVYETNQVRHTAFSYTGSFSEITACTMTVKNESDITQGSYDFAISDGLVTQQVIKNASGTPVLKFTYTYSPNKEITQIGVYNDGSTLSYTTHYSYDNWGNTVYVKNAEGHEQFFSYSNTNTSGFFVDNNGTVIRTFTDAFSSDTVPSTVHTALLGAAEKQDLTYVREVYLTYDSEAHPTQSTSAFGNVTTWLTFSGTFNEKTGNTSFPIDLTGHTVAGNAVLQITGLPSDDTYQESHSTNCPSPGCMVCGWMPYGSGWSNSYYTVHWHCCPVPFDCDEGYKSIGPFTHYPGTLGYQSYTTNPALGQSSTSFTVTTNWKAYPQQVQYNLDGSAWKTITSSLRNTTANLAVSIEGGSHTLYFSESSSQMTKFSWTLWVPVDNSPDTYTASMQYDTYGSITSVTDTESNTITFTYSSTYSYAYLTEISASVGNDTITVKATYDYSRGWITSLQEPNGVAGSGYDYLYTYDVLGRITKKEFPLLSGQSQRYYLEAVYDDTNRNVTIIDQLRHYMTRHYDKLGRPTGTQWYTGTYGSGTLYATESYTYRYDNLMVTITDPGSDTYTYVYDFLGRCTQITYPNSVSVSYSYDDTINKVTFINARSCDRIYWHDWLNRLTKVEEEYVTDTFAATTYQYDELGHLTSFTDAENHTTSFTYASFFGLTKTTYPDSEYEEYAYDNMGNVTTFTDCKGNDTTYTYDALYQLIRIEYEDQSTVSLTYDLNGNRTRMEDDAPNADDYIEYSYDYWNRMTSKTRHISTSTYTVSYEYNATSHLTILTYPDNMQILYSYDDLNRSTDIKRYVDGSNDEVIVDNIQYDVESLPTQFDYGNGLQATYTYDSMDRPLTIDVKDGQTAYLDLDFTWDSNSNIIQIVNGWRDTNSIWHSDTESYSYDGLDRLTSASCTSWSHTYSYDKVGNRTAKDSVIYTINNVNEVTALSDGTLFTYDSNGNRTQENNGTDTWIYIYDYANRLTRVEKNSESLGEYVYDGDGKRMQVTENSATTTYIYSGLSILYEENSDGTATYVYGPTGLMAKRTTINEETGTYYYHTDHLDSTRLVTDSNKNIVFAATYHPFGEVDFQEGSEEYLFTGKEKDTTGLYYFGARYYDAKLGRFITRDTWSYLPNDFRSFGQAVGQWMSDPQIFNRYAYCRNNPLKYIDPSGHSWNTVLAAVVAVLCVIAIIVIPVGTPIWVQGIAYALAVVAIYDTIWCFFQDTRIKVEIGYGDLDQTVINEVEWYDGNGNRIGGWKKVEGGYLVWSTELNAWVPVPDDAGWTPPPPPKPGEATEPVTYEGIKDLLLTSQNDDPEVDPNPSNPSGSSSSSQGGGAQAGTKSYAI